MEFPPAHLPAALRQVSTRRWRLHAALAALRLKAPLC